MFMFNVSDVAFPPVPLAGMVINAELLVPPKGELATVALVTVVL